MRIHMMDMGGRRYGDCTVVTVGGVTILIDGGHKGDERSVEEGGTDLVGQIEAALNTPPPFEFDLLVVTHAHADHVGCLPELVAGGHLTARWTLAVDEDLSFGRRGSAATDAVTRVVAAMREEPLPRMATDGEISTAIDEAATLEERYRAMLATLAESGRVARLGRDATVALEREFAGAGVKVVGPTVDQLLRCADAIEKAREAATRRTRRAASADSTAHEVHLYRAIATASGRDRLAGSDRSSIGNDGVLASGEDGADTSGDASAPDGSGSAAVNCQSVILRVSHGGVSALFLGDMQFAEPQVTALRPMVDGLKLALRSAGPYGFVRLPHHGASNGTDADLLEMVGRSSAFGLSGGTASDHPSRGVLELLDASAESGWARTDLNGGVCWSAGTDRPWSVSRGTVGDATPPASAGAAAVRRAGRRREAAQAAASGTHGPLAAGRALPRLLFVTSSKRLEQRVGVEAAGEAIGLIRAAGQQVLDVLDPADAVTMTRATAAASDGVVLVGGYDVLPGQVVDALPVGTRRSLSRDDRDPDGHVVWSDDQYVSLDGIAPDLPVSRIPDGGDGEFLLAALRTRTLPDGGTFGLRNFERPFAEDLFAEFSKGGSMHVAEPSRSGGYADAVRGDAYLMLHCGHEDCGRFWGSDGNADSFLVSDVPGDFAGSVFSGCCYGALVVDVRASDVAGRVGTVAALGPDSSIALRFLRNGARAFVGATGVHYSPLVPPWNDAGGPLHAFYLRALAAGKSPARALFDAKIDFIKSLRIDVEPGENAIAFKTWRQFGCLGLGW